MPNTPFELLLNQHGNFKLFSIMKIKNNNIPFEKIKIQISFKNITFFYKVTFFI
jgi:hypothetical protein